MMLISLVMTQPLESCGRLSLIVPIRFHEELLGPVGNKVVHNQHGAYAKVMASTICLLKRQDGAITFIPMK